MKKSFLILLLSYIFFSCNNLDIFQFELAPSNITMYSTEQRQLTAAISFAGKDSLNLEWSSSNTEVATVNNVGIVTALEPGNATISVTCEGLKKDCEVTVTQEIYIPLTAQMSDHTAVFLWKNGEINQISQSNFNAYSSGIDVCKKDIYISGRANSTTGTDSIAHACYWKNGLISLLPDDSTSIGKSISVDCDSVYVAGTSISNSGYESVCYWINGRLEKLNYNGCANDIYAKHEDVILGGYIIANGGKQPTIWKNSVPSTLNGGNGEVSKIKVIDNIMYAVGYIEDNGIHKAALWVDGALTLLCDFSSEANGISIYHGKVFVCYNRFDQVLNYPFIWNDGKSTALLNSGNENYCAGIGVTSLGVYVAGWEKKYIINENSTISNPFYWSNNDIIYLDASTSDLKPSSIYVR